jgi:hypothetical protein
MASTKQSKHSNPLQTRRAALTTPPGAPLHGGSLGEQVRFRGRFREGW